MKHKKTDEKSLATRVNMEVIRAGDADVPDYIQSDAGLGMEEVGRDDSTLPRLALCQSMTRQRKPTSPLYIDDLKEGDLFNTLSKMNYHDRVKILPLFMYKTRIKFNPLDEGGGIDCQSFNAVNGGRHSQTCAACQYNQWIPSDNGTDKPTCNLFYNYVVVVNDEFRAPVVLSMKSSQIKIAKSFNSLVRLYGNNVMFSRYYELTTVPEKNQMGEFYNFNLQPLGWTPKELYQAAKKMFESLKQRPLKIDIEGVEDEFEEPGSTEM